LRNAHFRYRGSIEYRDTRDGIVIVAPISGIAQHYSRCSLLVVNHHHHHHQFNTHECSMNNKIHEKAHTIIQKESTKKIQKDE